MTRSDLFIVAVAASISLGTMATSARAVQLDPKWPPIGAHVTGQGQFPSDVVSTSDQAGGSIMAWMDFTGGNGNIYANRVLASGELAWSNWALPIIEGPFTQHLPAVVTDGSQGAFIAWSTEGTHGVFVQHVLGDGSFDPAWPAQGVLLGSGQQAGGFEFNLFPDGAGGAVAMWVSQSPSTAQAQRVRADGSLAWGAGISLTPNTGNHWSPGQCVPDGSGGFILIYDGAQVLRARAKRVRANGTLDPAWGANGLALNSSWPVEIRAVSDGAGGAMVVLSDQRAGNDDLFAHHVLGSGALDPAWPYGGAVLCDVPAGLSEGFFDVVSDGAGGGYVAWNDERDYATTGQRHVFAHRLTPSGPDPAWPEDGLAISHLYADAQSLVPDGAGGAILGWSEYSPNAVRAIGLDSDGIQPDWPEDGFLVSSGQHAGSLYSMNTDEAGGAVMVWRAIYGQCYETCTATLFAHHLIVNGGPTHVSHPGSVASGRLFPAAPNPSSGSTLLRFQLDAEGTISLDVHDHQGRLVRQVAAGTRQAGEHRERWDGRDEHGRPMPPGLYLVRLVLPDSRSLVSRVALVR